jgi:hypothetical protein
MINNNMDSTKDEIDAQLLPQPTRPNESTGIYVRGLVKITDPETGEVLLETAN